MNPKQNDDVAMAAVGRQFLRLATENEQLRSDLQKVVEMFNNLKAENDKLKTEAATGAPEAKE